MKGAILLASLACNVAGAADHKTPVYLEIIANEPLSKQFAYEIQEAIRSSQKLQLTDDAGLSLQQVRLTMLDDGGAVAYAKVRTLANSLPLPFYLKSAVGVCGRDRFVSCAMSLLAELDQEIESDNKNLDEARAAKKRDSAKD